MMAMAEGEGIECLFANPELSTDNAAMIAAAGALRFERGETSPWTLDANPNLRLVPLDRYRKQHTGRS
jgi:N6-L-threonylcarbamoyladenine synthase